MIENLRDFAEAMDRIASLNWVTTHRSGPTGIGKTLEDLLGIEESNIIAPDFGIYELKAARTTDTSMLTLFTKNPLPRGANSKLLKKYGYVSENYEHDGKFDTTLSVNRPTPISTTGRTLIIECNEKRINIVGNDNTVEAYWDREILRKVFEKKYLHSLIYVEANARGQGRSEEFLFNIAYELSGFNYDSMIELLERGVVKIDIRIGQYPDGSTHDHGTGFRIQPQYFEELFLVRNEVWRRKEI